MQRIGTMTVVVGVMGLVCGLSAMAGPINPPVGAVASTFKTLQEVEPRIAISATNTPGDATSSFKIIASGSYYLTGNITGVAGKHGIAIAASGVTLDLNGFDVTGVPAMGLFDGVSTVGPGLTSIAVVNGSVRGWGRSGVDCGTSLATNCRVDGVLASGNTVNGILVGVGSIVSNCVGSSNGATGIITGFACTLSNCSVSSNAADGISANSFSTVTGCMAYLNVSKGIRVGTGSTLANCVANSNSDSGFGVTFGCTVTHCSASSNAANGIITSSSSFSTGCTIADCTVRQNGLDGIVCSSGCVIRGNTCDSNGNLGDGAGIHATLGDNRIEGNNCTLSDRGIRVDFAGNMIVRNTCSGNTTANWDVAAGNVCLVVQGAVGSAAILGNTGGVAPGSTDPNANFSY